MHPYAIIEHINPCGYAGLASVDEKKALVMQRATDSNIVLQTTLHEICHWIGGPDHYDLIAGNNDLIPTTQEINDINHVDTFSSDCIYGEYNYDTHVVHNLIICQGCKDKIKAYIEKYYK